MKQFIFALTLLCVCLAAQAQNTTIIGGGSYGEFKKVSSYQGPGDIVSGATAWYSCARAYNAAYAAALGAVCDVVDSATGLTACTYHATSSGKINPSECNGAGQACATACKVKKAYDQTGNGNDAAQATLSAMPTLTFNALNSLPAIKFNSGTSQTLLTSTTFTQAQPYSMSIVVDRLTVANTGGYISFDTSAIQLRGSSAGNLAISCSTAVAVPATDSVFHAVNAICSGSSSAVRVDATDTTSIVAGTTALSANALWLGKSAAGLFSDNNTMEAGFWPSGFTTQNRTDLNTNQHGTNGYNF